MNNQRQFNQPSKNNGSDMLSPNRPPRGRKKPNEKLLRTLRSIMLFAGGMIAMLGLLLLLLPLFRVQNIVVEGNSYCTSEDIIAATGIEAGDELLALDLQTALKNVFAECPNVENCSISISFPFTVKIKVTEKSGVMYAAFNDKYVSFDRSFRVLEMIQNGETDFSPFLFVKLPTLSAAGVGQKLVFSDLTLDTGYMTSLLGVLEEHALYETVTYVDFSERFSLSFVLEGKCRVEMGKLSEVDTKVRLMKEMLSQKGGAAATYAVVDVSNPEKPTYARVDAEEIFD
ncbi:MAG: FtsQ-type POTRA domain-containing protein [Clostridia bacterium]|nr:FtsQ-type POTRA domain-containing protein [Clostridia bacterium]